MSLLQLILILLTHLWVKSHRQQQQWNVSQLNAHLVSLRTLHHIKSSGDNHFCTGIILTERHILTSAHCITDKRGLPLNKRRFRVAFYSFKSSKEELVRVEHMLVYPLYERNQQDDLALIKLSKSLKLKEQHLSIATIGSSDLTIGTRCFSIGWSIQRGARRPRTDSLLMVEVILKPFTDCLTEKHTNSDALDYLMCVERTEFTSCLTDFGGPIFCGQQLYGLALGRADCFEFKPIFFSHVPHYKNWIQKMTLS